MREPARTDAPWELPAKSLAVALALALLALCAALLGSAPDLVPAPAASAVEGTKGIGYCLPALAVALSRRREST